MPSGFHIKRGVLVLIVACACALAVEWVVLTTYVFPRPFDGWSVYAEEYYYLAQECISSANYESVKATAKEIAMQTDRVVNIVDVRESICRTYVERRWRMPSNRTVDLAYTNGFESNVTIVPGSTIDTMEKAYLALEVWEYTSGDRERIIELLALDEQ